LAQAFRHAFGEGADPPIIVINRKSPSQAIVPFQLTTIVMKLACCGTNSSIDDTGSHHFFDLADRNLPIVTCTPEDLDAFIFLKILTSQEAAPETLLQNGRISRGKLIGAPLSPTYPSGAGDARPSPLFPRQVHRQASADSA
jgi:hypothetical protein